VHFNNRRPLWQINQIVIGVAKHRRADEDDPMAGVVRQYGGVAPDTKPEDR
jgi:hypothetical protein